MLKENDSQERLRFVESVRCLMCIADPARGQIRIVLALPAPTRGPLPRGYDYSMASKQEAADAEAMPQPEDHGQGSTEKYNQAAEDVLPHGDESGPFEVSVNNKIILCEKHGRSSSPALIFTHGAGGGIQSPAFRTFAEGFANASALVCFQGTMNLSSRVKAFHAVIEHAKADAAALGGRSMGARAAVLTALEREQTPEALVLVSYPLTAGKKGEKREPERREQILLELPECTDVLFMVGSKDPQCDLSLLAEIRQKMSAGTWLTVLQDADHGLGLRSEEATQAIRSRAGCIAAQWLRGRDESKRLCQVSWHAEKAEIVCEGWIEDQTTITPEPDHEADRPRKVRKIR